MYNYFLQLEDKILHVKLRSEWPPPEVTEEQTTIHPPKIKLDTPKLRVPLNVSDLGYSPNGSPHLSPYVSPSQSPHLSPRESCQDSPYHSPQVSPRGSPLVSARGSPNASPRDSPIVSPKDSPTVSPKDSLTVSPRDSLHSSPYHSAEESPYHSPGESPQQSPLVSAHSSPRESPQPSPKLPRHTDEDNELITSNQQPVKEKPVVPSRTKCTTKVSCVSQYHEEISKARRRSTPTEVSIRYTGHFAVNNTAEKMVCILGVRKLWTHWESLVLI